jgi:L-seryl-tRNA(Ser) seleniumtransferase
VRIEKLLENAQNLGRLLESLEVPGLVIQVEKAKAPVGGGSVPGFAVESAVVRMGGTPIGVESLARQLRSCPVPIMARIQDNSVLFDVRTLLSGDNEIICNSVKDLLSKHSRKKG